MFNQLTEEDSYVIACFSYTLGTFLLHHTFLSPECKYCKESDVSALSFLQSFYRPCLAICIANNSDELILNHSLNLIVPMADILFRDWIRDQI